MILMTELLNRYSNYLRLSQPSSKELDRWSSSDQKDGRRNLLRGF